LGLWRRWRAYDGRRLIEPKGTVSDAEAELTLHGRPIRAECALAIETRRIADR